MNQAAIAGKFLELANNELIHEGMEGVMGGGLAGMGLMGTDTPPEQIAIQTLAGMALGTGIGMLGNRAGAAIGKLIHSQKLKNQQGLLATFGRALGQKTLVKGGAEMARHTKDLIKSELQSQSMEQLMREAMTDPQAFKKAYNLDDEVFKAMAGNVDVSNKIVGGLKTFANLPDEQRKMLFDQIMKQQAAKDFVATESVINNHASNQIENNIKRMAKQTKGTKMPGTEVDVGSMFEELLKEPTAITGEHVGRAVGRFLGDEIGVVSGLGLGGMISQGLGIKSEKDKKIEQLEAELGRPSYQ